MNHAIILAAGEGKRMKMRNKDKALLTLADKPLVYSSLMTFNDHQEVDTITIVASKGNKKQIEATVKESHFPKVAKVVLGGKTRMESLEKGLAAVKADKDDNILVHNAANPFVSTEEIDQSIEKSPCIVGHYVKSTVKEVDDQHIIKTHDRDKLFLAETPQTAPFHNLQKALAAAKKKGIEATDEAMLLELNRVKVAYVEANENNFKITTEADYQKAKAIMGELPEDFRVGLGQDSHVFSEEEMGLVIGGLELKDQPKLEANSDGDVILHAVFNAISQALGDMSLGFYADPMCAKGIKDSKKYLVPIMKKMKQQKFVLNSVGIMMECKKPKIDPLVPKLRKSLAKILGLDTRKVGVTATSGEYATVFGEGLGIQCFAIVSLVKK